MSVLKKPQIYGVNQLKSQPVFKNNFSFTQVPSIFLRSYLKKFHYGLMSKRFFNWCYGKLQLLNLYKLEDI